MSARVIAGRYQILEKVGAGGAAQVYKAMDTRLKRVVALKFLHESYLHDPTFVQRFEREAQAAAGLGSPNIVHIYDFEQADGQYFIVMEYLPHSLRDHLRRHARLPEHEARRLVSQVLEGLAIAHAAGLIHRDMKPQNVLLADQGQPKISDFGIVKALGRTMLTQSGKTPGTPQYMAPEQVKGEEVTPRTDLYAVGVMLYEMLSGRLPFEGEEPMLVALAHVLREPKPLREVAPHVSPAMAAAVEKALAKDPEARFPNAEEMRKALQNTANANAGDTPTVIPKPQDPAVTADLPPVPHPVTPPPPPPAPSRRLWTAISGVVGMLLIAGIAIGAIMSRSGGPGSPERESTPGTQVAANPGSQLPTQPATGTSVPASPEPTRDDSGGAVAQSSATAAAPATTVPTTVATRTGGTVVTLKKVVESETTSGVTVTATTVELLPGDKMRWNFLFANDSDEDTQLTLSYRDTYLSDERGQLYAVLRDSVGTRPDGSFDSEFRAHVRLGLWIEFPAPKDGAINFTVALGNRSFGPSFPTFQVKLKFNPG